MADFRLLKYFFVNLITILSLITACPLQGVQNKKKGKKYDLVICALFRNEAFFLKEWIEFHKLMGVQHFYLYNNLSTDNYLDILSPYLKSGEVDLFDAPIENTSQQENLFLLQLPVYRQALKIVKKTAKWAAFIDLDEFLFPVQENNLISFLKQYETYPALVVNWQTYGTSYVDQIPPQSLIIENLILKLPTEFEGHHMVKSIVQPKYVQEIYDPHSFAYFSGLYAVNSNGEPIEHNNGRHPSIVIDKIRINHYWFGTTNWFFKEKLPRRKNWGLSLNPEQIEQMIQGANVVRDESILRFAPMLRPKLFPVL